MQPYDNPDSGIREYEAGPNYIRIRFSDGGLYRYGEKAPGRRHVEAMKRLAASGDGLNTYINQFVRDNYEEHEADE